MMGDLVLGFIAGLVIATITAPVGVSGAVFLLPVQLSLLAVPNPAVTPSNLLYNVIAGPGALLRHARSGRLWSQLTRVMLLGTLPGVVAGATIRVYLLPGSRPFRIVAGVMLLCLGLWLVRQTALPLKLRRMRPGTIAGISLLVGTIGGIYGIGGGSILSPLLVGSGMAVAVVAPAALTSTFVTSIIGAATFAFLQVWTKGSIAPDWPIGIACGLGGLAGSYLGAALQPRLPEQSLRLLLGGLAVALGAIYLLQAAG